MTMHLGRIIFVAVLALSVATLPAAVGFAAGSKAMEVVATETMTDCDHHHNVPSNKTQKSMDDCASMAACAVACFGFTAIGFSSITFLPPISTAPKFIRTSENVSSRMGNLPFRPPRA